eukprot:CAMPEP_0206630198 /NCGR_PEP_ID=MMETSP0325_2-20121206/67440_1 /ASSEMBLY_ACC=CAM_ASM_000347 /TAXON_ID=2866 /ORGANISM="Crypthecodinium cohnii, Strain Seligo" /LENGTH=127 /DNA_ID=CAMNT_0054155031 /DNA_START=804 /DNA_END=1189 /DNA_ORIENTATION=-
MPVWQGRLASDRTDISDQSEEEEKASGSFGTRCLTTGPEEVLLSSLFDATAELSTFFAVRAEHGNFALAAVAATAAGAAEFATACAAESLRGDGAVSGGKCAAEAAAVVAVAVTVAVAVDVAAALAV